MTKYMSRPEAAAYLGVSRQTIDGWRRAGVIGHHTLANGAFRYTVEDLERAVKPQDDESETPDQKVAG